MTKFTPEDLARTDFRLLLREDPAVARERLKALVANPEALSLYGDVLASCNEPTSQLTVPTEWDELRRRILREGLDEATVDTASLAHIALDYNLLVEIQFDLYSTEVLGASWRKVRELSGEGIQSDLGDAPSPVELPDGPQTAVDPAPGSLSNLAGVRDLGNIPRPSGDAGFPLRTSAAVSGSSELPSCEIEWISGVEALDDWFTHRDRSYQPTVDGRFWSIWSTHLVQYAAHRDSSSNREFFSRDGRLRLSGSHEDSFAIGCLNLMVSSARGDVPARVDGCWHCQGRRRLGKPSWRRWLRRFVTFLSGGDSLCNGTIESLLSQSIHVNHAFQTSIVDWIDDELGSTVLVVDATSPTVINEVERRGLKNSLCRPKTSDQRVTASGCLAGVRCSPEQTRSPKAPQRPSENLIGTV